MAKRAGENSPERFTLENAGEGGAAVEALVREAATLGLEVLLNGRSG